MSIPRHDGDPSAAPVEDTAVLWERYAALAAAPRVEHDTAGTADAAADASDERDRVVAELVRRHPDRADLWYDLGMYAKWRRDWPTCLDANRRALDLLPDGGTAGEPAAWNLGIAATALRDWTLARRAWTAYGIDLPDGDGPDAEVVADFGAAPVRLNPSPRFAGEPEHTVDGAAADTEVVWGRRICPARVRIVSVPTSGTRHRFGDVVLHDGDPVGTRVLEDRRVSVFNEIALWRRSDAPTVTATVDAPSAGDADALQSLAEGAGLGVEDWTASLQLLCRACSEGSTDDPDHRHESPGEAWNPLRTMAFGGRPDDVRPLLEHWARSGRGRAWTDLEIVLG